MDVKTEPSISNCDPVHMTDEPTNDCANITICKTSVKQEAPQGLYDDYNLMTIKPENLDLKEETVIVDGMEGAEAKLDHNQTMVLYDSNCPKKKTKEEKSFACKLCEYRTTHKGHFNHHMKIHTGEKPYACSVCEYRTAHKGHLNLHMKIHTGEKPFACCMCDYRAVRKDILKRHMKGHTGERPFECSACEYKAIYKENLKQHMKVHTGEKPFVCGVCDYRATHKATLDRHMAIHRG